MNQAKATLSDYRQSPRKVRGVINMIRGKSILEAENLLSFVPKRSAGPVQKLLASAVANAKNLSIPLENLIVKNISVDGGKILYRRLPMSRGRAFVIRKRTSNVGIVLGEKATKVKKLNKSKKLNKENSKLIKPTTLSNL